MGERTSSNFGEFHNLAAKGTNAIHDPEPFVITDPRGTDDELSGIALDVYFSQHLGGRLVEQTGATNFFKPPRQIFHAKASFLCPSKVMDDLPMVHHDQPIPEVYGLLHGMSHHQRGQAVRRDNWLAKLLHVICRQGGT